MDTTTLNQLIESGSLVLIIIIILKFYSMAVAWKFDVKKEIKLLKDIIFFRSVIDIYSKYTDDNELGNNINKFRKTAANKLDYNPSTFSEPAEIKRRLEMLINKGDDIEKFIEKLPLIEK